MEPLTFKNHTILSKRYKGQKSHRLNPDFNKLTPKVQLNCHLYTEVASVHVVSQEEVASVIGWSSNFKQLHQVKELPMNITTH